MSFARLTLRTRFGPCELVSYCLGLLVAPLKSIALRFASTVSLRNIRDLLSELKHRLGVCSRSHCSSDSNDCLFVISNMAMHPAALRKYAEAIDLYIS